MHKWQSLWTNIPMTDLSTIIRYFTSLLPLMSCLYANSLYIPYTYRSTSDTLSPLQGIHLNAIDGTDVSMTVVVPMFNVMPYRGSKGALYTMSVLHTCISPFSSLLERLQVAGDGRPLL